MDTVHKARYVARERAFSAQNLDAFALIKRVIDIQAEGRSIE